MSMLVNDSALPTPHPLLLPAPCPLLLPMLHPPPPAPCPLLLPAPNAAAAAALRAAATSAPATRAQCCCCCCTTRRCHRRWSSLWSVMATAGHWLSLMSSLSSQNQAFKASKVGKRERKMWFVCVCLCKVQTLHVITCERHESCSRSSFFL